MIFRQQTKAMRLSLIALGIIALIVTGLAVWQPAVLTAVVERSQAKVAASGDSEGKPADQIGQEAKAEDKDASHGESPEHEQALALNSGELQDLGIKLAVAERGPITSSIERLAEIKFDNNRVAHVVPRVAGVVSQVEASQGENISRGALLAVINSRELAELNALYLANYARRELARQTFERENRLWEKKISSEKDYLDAKTAFAEADIALTASAQKLRALGLSQQYIDSLNDSKGVDLTAYEIRAPITGIIIERHLSLGEAVSTDQDIFVVADTSTVWVDITIYPADMAAVQAGQLVQIDPGDGNTINGTIAFVTPNVNEETRTGSARVIISGADRRLKPGMFVKAKIEVAEEQADIRLPRSAVQNFANGLVVFVKDGEKFEPRQVELGRDSAKFVEVVSGLKAGETYVAEGAFTIKSLILKSEMGEGHAD